MIMRMISNTLQFLDGSTKDFGCGENLGPLSHVFMAIGMFQISSNTHVTQGFVRVIDDILHFFLIY